MHARELVLILMSCTSCGPSLPSSAPAASASAAPVAPVASPTAGPTASPTASSAGSAADTDDVAWTAHVCAKTVSPGEWRYDAVPRPVEETQVVLSERGLSKDDKLALLAKLPLTGTCDARLRDKLETAIARGGGGTAIGATPAWDKASALEHASLVRSALALTPDEEARLGKDGFVVPARLAYDDYATAYSEIHRGQLPVFVSVDSVLHAIYISHDQLTASLESELLIERLDKALGAMHCELVQMAPSLPPEIADDVDLYLAVARSLLAGQTVPTELGHVEAAAQTLVGKITEATGVATISLFGRDRAIDYAAFAPRGHYAGVPELETYFRAAMWLSRTEMNLVSRDSRSSQPGYSPDPRETPREAVVALALAELADRAKATTNLRAIEAGWTAFAGRREDISLDELRTLRTTAHITDLRDPDAAAKLRLAIGDRFPRTVNVHPMPNVAHLPAIATMIGPRIVPDTVALGHLADGRGPQLSAPEVGYVLGHDRALAHLSTQLGTDRTLRGRLDAARVELASATAGEDLYSAWLDAIKNLAKHSAGALPSFMATDAFADLRLDSALVGFGQLRHDHVLLAARMYDQGGCEIPDGYVEPALDTYVALERYAKRGKDIFAKLDPKGVTKGTAYFTKLGTLMNVLAQLSREELANHALSPAAKRFLAMIVEDRQTDAHGYNGSFPIALHDGWYLDLFPFQDAAFKPASFIADYAAYDRNGASGIHYLGGKGPHLGIFVVDTNGKPRLMVGPVAQGFQTTTSRAHTLDDEAATPVAGTAPWTTSYTLAAPTAPDIAVEYHRSYPGDSADREDDPDAPVSPASKPPTVPPTVTPPKPHARPAMPGMGPYRPRLKMATNTLRIDSARDQGEIAVDLLDHHYVTMSTVKIRVPKGRTDMAIAAASLPRPIEALRVRAGAFVQKLDLNLLGGRRFVFGTDPAPPNGRLPGTDDDR